MTQYCSCRGMVMHGAVYLTQWGFTLYQSIRTSVFQHFDFGLWPALLLHCLPQTTCLCCFCVESIVEEVKGTHQHKAFV